MVVKTEGVPQVESVGRLPVVDVTRQSFYLVTYDVIRHCLQVQETTYARLVAPGVIFTLMSTTVMMYFVKG